MAETIATNNANQLNALAKAMAFVAISAVAATAAAGIYILGHEATHCVIGYAAGSTECSIEFWFRECKTPGTTLSGYCFAYAHADVPGRSILDPVFNEVAASAGGIAFVLVLPVSLSLLGKLNPRT